MMSLASTPPAALPVAPAPGRSLLALCLLVPAATLGTLAGLKWGPGTWWGQGLYLLGKAWLLAVPTFWLLVIERRRPSLSPARHGGLLAGLLLGVGVAGAIVAGYALATWMRWIDPAPMRALVARNDLNRPLVYIGFAAWTTLVNALLEEYVWRWFVVRLWEDVLAPGMLAGAARATIAALLAAACFTLHHTVVLSLYFDWPAVALGSVGVFAGGVIWSALYVRYRSIWPAYICHICADIAIFIVGWRIIFA